LRCPLLWRQREVEAEVGAAYKRAAETSDDDQAFDQVGLRLLAKHIRENERGGT
jgi:hypothetical protein